MALTISEINRLKHFLRDLSDRREGLSELANAMKKKRKVNPSSPQSVSPKTLGRIVKDYSSEDIYNGRYPSATQVYKFLEQNKWTIGGEPIKLSDQIAAFLQTSKMQYSELHLHRLCGRYFMYRRYWLDPYSNQFMRSYVSISYNIALDFFQIREFQKWKHLGTKNFNRGYLFPSGQAVLAILNSPQKNTVKFLSITNLQSLHEDADMKESRPQVFEEIMRYERFRGVDFIPYPPELMP